MPSQKMLDQLNELHREFLALGADVEELVGAAVCALGWPDSDKVAKVVTGDNALAERSPGMLCGQVRGGLSHQPLPTAGGAGDFRQGLGNTKRRVSGAAQHRRAIIRVQTRRTTGVLVREDRQGEGGNRLG